MSIDCHHQRCRNVFECRYIVGERVQLHPATDAWMQGDRFGCIVKIGRKYIHVVMDISGRKLRVIPDLICA